MPAGTDTKVRTPGISRPQNTTAVPWRLNQRRLLARSSGWIASQPEIRTSFIQRPMPYQNQITGVGHQNFRGNGRNEIFQQHHKSNRCVTEQGVGLQRGADQAW